ncbi:MAG: LPS assembly protein LptD [Holosporaceae bacterium]|jgi:LPS-assembly protein|nr:LPS assembly protein LptD [Holosporaceae bacterium]
MIKKILPGFLIFCFFHVECENIKVLNSDNTRYGKDYVRCSGNVLVMYHGHIISANSISYDRREESIHAEGNVVIKDTKQNVYFLDSLSVGKRFSTGEGRNIRIILQDQSRLAAGKCVIKDAKYELENVIYTPCYECVYAGELTWQIKALRVIFDPEDQTEYHQAKFELLGTPIFYSPYLMHVSPKVKRKSGFLAPKFSTSSKSGFSVVPSYLWSISDSQELILKPIVTSKIGNVGWLYYGLRFPNGEFNVDTSFTGIQSVSAKDQIVSDDDTKNVQKIKDSGYRGHLFSKMRYEINDTWRSAFDLNLASDNYYLKRFPFLGNTDRILESNARLEGFDGRNYTCAKAARFQCEYTECIPRIVPQIERNYSMNLLGGTLGMDAFFANLDFGKQKSCRKFVFDVSWQKEILLPWGHLLNFRGTLSLQAQNVTEKQKSRYDSFLDVKPQLNVLWKWPLMISSRVMNTIFTPLLGVIVSGNKKNIDIFEEPFYEITDLNFLDGSRAISPYNTDPGKRICYGFRMAGYRGATNLYHLTVGRSYEMTILPKRLGATGLKDRNSNIVGSMDIFLSDSWTFISIGSYAPRSKRWTKIETGLNFSNKKVCMDLMIFKGKQCFYNPFVSQDFQEEQKTQKYRGVMLDVGWHATGTLKLKCGMTIGNGGRTLKDTYSDKDDSCRLVRHSAGLEYRNECTTVDFLIERRNYRGGDLKPETALRLVVCLKNLGGSY